VPGGAVRALQPHQISTTLAILQAQASKIEAQASKEVRLQVNKVHREEDSQL
jgi:hypothetical protein